MSRAVAIRFLNDYGDTYTFNLQENDGTASDLTGATVLFQVRLESSQDVILNKAMSIVGAPTNGVVSVVTAVTDFPSAGKYYCQVQATYGAKVITWDVMVLFVQADIA